jgi:hypothetical protein
MPNDMILDGSFRVMVVVPEYARETYHPVSSKVNVISQDDVLRWWRWWQASDRRLRPMTHVCGVFVQGAIHYMGDYSNG